MTLALSPVELRVLGSLIEKERATPQGYPLTGNSLRLACNQSSNRQPVVDYDDHLIETTVAGLKEQGLLRFVYSPSNRATKYRHVLDEALHLSDDELAVLCVLFLRGPQTVGEIKGRTERLHRFTDLADVESTLRRLSERDDGAFVRRLDRQPGQKDARSTSRAPLTSRRHRHLQLRHQRPRRRRPTRRRRASPRSSGSPSSCATSSRRCAPSSRTCATSSATDRSPIAAQSRQ
jgi:uncharacterized protein YceH (UPF0502 family)